MAERPRVALDVETSLVYGRQILDGVSRYLRANRPWSIYLEQHGLATDLPGLLKRWNGDGIITRQATAESARLLRRRRLAAIDLGDIQGDTGIVADRIGPRRHRPDGGDASAGARLRELRLLRILPTSIGRSAAATALSRRSATRGFECSVYESPRAGLHGVEARSDATAGVASSRCRNPSASSPPTTCAGSMCSMRAAAPISPCPSRWRSSASTMTSWCATCAIRRCRA